MVKEINSKRLTVILNDDMMKCAVEKGYKIPCVSISHYYGNVGVFKITYKDNLPDKYELEVQDKAGKFMALYLLQ